MSPVIRGITRNPQKVAWWRRFVAIASVVVGNVEALGSSHLVFLLVLAGVPYLELRLTRLWRDRTIPIEEIAL